MRRLSLPLLALLFSGCITLEGSGVVGGELYILGCNEADNYGVEQFPAYFDLMANFFVGEPIKDESAVATQNRLDIRIQKGTNTIEDADLLYIQITRVALAARRFSSYEPLPVGVHENVKASLSLSLTCPTFFDGPEANATLPEACPSLTQNQQEELCENMVYGRWNQLRIPMEPFTVGHSCLVVCQFGDTKRGDTIGEEFSIDFGDVVSGFFFFTLNNRRHLYDNVEICDDGTDNDCDGTVDEPLCIPSSTGGFIQGNFSVKLRRAKAIQAFP